ncbi:MAG: DUF4430 domain-containing protein [Gaiellaceae bacterium]
MRLAAVAVLAVALAGCGSSSTTSSAGRATLWVTRDRGAQVLHLARVPAGTSVMQALDRIASVKTRFGGRYVREVDGLEEHGRTAWFYYVNGYLADRSAAAYKLRAGDLAWWDYRAWRNPADDPLVVGAFPQPFLNGYDGQRRRTVIVSPDASAVRALARRLHATIAQAGIGMVASDVNTIEVAPGRTSARLEFSGPASPGAPIRLSFTGNPNVLLQSRPFRYRYEVEG